MILACATGETPAATEHTPAAGTREMISGMIEFTGAGAGCQFKSASHVFLRRRRALVGGRNQKKPPRSRERSHKKRRS